MFKLIEFIKYRVLLHRIIKYESMDIFTTGMSEIGINNKINEEKRQKQSLFEGEEGKALALLLAANGDENATNSACDMIKALGLVEGYK